VNVIATATTPWSPADQRREHSPGVAITPNGQYAYVANNVSDNVSVISTATNLVVQTISAPGGPDD